MCLYQFLYYLRILPFHVVVCETCAEDHDLSTEIFVWIRFMAGRLFRNFCGEIFTHIHMLLGSYSIVLCLHLTEIRNTIFNERIPRDRKDIPAI